MSAIAERTEIIDNLVTTTFYSVRKQIIDNIFTITPFVSKMLEQGQIRAKVPDGLHYEIPIAYDKQDQNMEYFTRGTQFGTAEKETLTRLIYYTKNLGVGIPRYFLDDQKNKGMAKLIDYANYLVQSAKDSLTDKMETDLIVQSSDANSFTALATLISTTPTTGTVGTITRSGNSHLQNNIKDFTGLTTGTSLLDEMDRMYNLCSLYKGGNVRTPNIILMARAVYQDFERIARAMQTIVTNTSVRASLGFGNMLFKNVECFWSPAVPAGYIYMLNTETLEFNYDPTAWFEMTPWKPIAGNSLDRTAQIVCIGNMCCNHFKKNGVIYNITTVTS